LEEFDHLLNPNDVKRIKNEFKMNKNSLLFEVLNL